MWKASTAAFAIAALAGALSSWHSPEAGSHSTPPVHQRSPIPTTRARWSRNEFLEKARQLDTSIRQPGYNPLADELADWSNDEIIAALDDCLHNPNVIVPGGSGFLFDHYLFHQLLLRDFETGLDWFEMIDSRPAQARLSSALSFRWPSDKAEQGFDFLRANRDLFVSPLLDKVIESRAKQGVAAVKDILTIIREEHIPFNNYSSIVLPDEFDFPALLGSGESEFLRNTGAAKPFIATWHARNREDAFDWLLQAHGAQSLESLPWYIKGDSSENQQWLGRKFEFLDPAQRAEYSRAMQPRWASDPNGVTNFSQGIVDPTIRTEVTSTPAKP